MIQLSLILAFHSSRSKVALRACLRTSYIRVRHIMDVYDLYSSSTNVLMHIALNHMKDTCDIDVISE